MAELAYAPETFPHRWIPNEAEFKTWDQIEPWYRQLSAGGFALDPATWAELRAWGDYDPGGDLGRLTTPTLAVFGENDPLVPVGASLRRYQQTAARAARYQATAVFPGADHRIQAGTGFAAGYLARLSTWCQEQGTRS